MKFTWKGGLLLFMIVGPLLFFGFLHLFGSNYYEIPKFYPTGVDNNGDTTYHQIPEFSFINQNGENVTHDDYRGYIYVADFFFTTCPTICPKMSSNMVYLQKGFRNHEEVKFISHTVDPDNDNVETLRAYADTYEVDDKVWNLVTGEKEKLYRHAREGYKIVAGEGDGFVHSEKMVLVDKKGVIRGYFDGTNKDEVEKLLSEIRILLYEQRDIE